LSTSNKDYDDDYDDDDDDVDITEMITYVSQTLHRFVSNTVKLLNIVFKIFTK